MRLIEAGSEAAVAYQYRHIWGLPPICLNGYSHSMNAVAIGIEMASLRRRAGLTQVELARRAGTTQAVISRLETGRKTPGIEALDRIARATGRPLKIVLGEAGNGPSRLERRRRVRQVLGDYRFDPWDRDPTPAEARALIADGISRGDRASS